MGSVARFSTTSGMTASTLDAHVAAAHEAELQTYVKFGSFARVAQAAQAAAMWNVKYNPIEYGPFGPPAPWEYVHVSLSLATSFCISALFGLTLL